MAADLMEEPEALRRWKAMYVALTSHPITPLRDYQLPSRAEHPTASDPDKGIREQS
jgi:hypothetical protein